ncbi:NB-ARC domain-containing protein [Epilithonimonas mollis]|uniref:NB-ARC domain-containing protein n=1 Tax=Epilithonimonas mollis TaxID=216903 RepID=A0A1M6URK0_9FLAO|nr:NB-ARC domain-containing protein [Epilithonimonas mollis]SHK71716.1 NB-ARC domain-containing protein [Epilithonimonas mollis]
MSKVTEVRLTLAALIYGIEIDLKSIIIKKIVPYNSDLTFFQNSDLVQKVNERFLKENPGVDILLNLEDAIDYIDFSDTFTILNKNKAFLTKDESDYLKKIFSNLSDLTPIRNRVMHTRPLLGGDFTSLYNFVSELKSTDPFNWPTTIETRKKIENDPSYVLTLSLPSLEYQTPETKVIHNLPLPDFDETGFIGRKNDIDDIKKLVFSNKVVSIIGDGGIGKTALALKIAYDIVDMGNSSPFELVIWTSAKTTMLTAKGIQEIYDAITNYTGLVDVISDTLKLEKNTKEQLSDILEYFTLFKTLLIIDNLETIQSEEVISFIREAQMRCNIIITSRIGLGELEYRRKLKGFSDTESARLIREIARIRDSEILLTLPQETLIDISTKLYHNPLAIKWFVNTVEAGISPSEVLNNKEDLLNFCLINVYDKLSDGAIKILNTIRASRKTLRLAEIIYLSELEPIDVRKYLLELFKTTLISSEITEGGNIEETNYYISDFAKDFLTKNYTIDIRFIKKISTKLRDLTLSASQLKKINNFNPFEINAITYRNSNEKIAAKFLEEALHFSWKTNYEEALKKVAEARNIVPSHFESYRVGAFIKATSGDLLGAEDDYKLGLEIDPKNHKLIYFYSQFLLFSMEDPDLALEYAEKLKNDNVENPSVSFLFVRIYNSKREYNFGIAKLKELLETKLDSKSERIAYTELISMYNHMGQSYATIEKDYDNSLRHFKRAITVYTECNNKKILDPKMIKNFCETILACIQMIPLTTLQENQEYLKNVIIDNDNKISLTNIKAKIIHKYYEKFDDYSISNLLEETSINTSKHIGTISRNHGNATKPFVFLEKEDRTKYYANMYDFIDVRNRNDWKSLRHGQLVSFEIGTNPLGECAKNIKIIE